MSTFSADMSIIHNAIGKIGMQMESAIPALDLSDETGNSLPLNAAIAADADYEPEAVNTESNFVVDNISRAMDWLEDLIRRVWAYVRKGLSLFRGTIKKYLGHASWLKRVFVKYATAFETLEKKNVKVNTCEWHNAEHPINLMGADGFNQAKFPSECKRLVELVSYVKGDYLTSAYNFAASFEILFNEATRLTPDEVIEQMNDLLKKIEATGQQIHPVAPFLKAGKEGIFGVEPVKGTSYDSKAYLRSTTPYLGGYVWTLSYGDNFDSDGKKYQTGYDDGLLKNVNSVVKFSVDQSTINKSWRISRGDKLEFTNDPVWIKESSKSLITAIDLVHELYLDTRIIDIENFASKVQASIDRYFSAIRSNKAYSESAGAHIAFIKMGAKFVPNIIQPLQGVPAAIIRISSSFVSLVDAALDSYETT